MACGPVGSSAMACYNKLVPQATAAREFYVAREGKQQGPLTEQQFKQDVAVGRFAQEDHVFVSGWPAWKRLDEALVELGIPLPPAPAKQPAPDNKPDYVRRSPTKASGQHAPC